MSAIELLTELPPDGNAQAWLILAHGAGAPMTSPFMEEISRLLSARGIAVARFEFAYMAQRRTTGKRRPPPKAERLAQEFEAAREAFDTIVPSAGLPVLIGGKSMGGRVATLITDSLFEAGRIVGAVALGYPFHPPGKPDVLRTAHLEALRAPLLIVQGERDPFGSRAEVEGYRLPPSIRLTWATDGDHDLGPRGGHGTTRKQNLAEAADAVLEFVTSLRPRQP